MEDNKSAKSDISLEDDDLLDCLDNNEIDQHEEKQSKELNKMIKE